MVSATTPRAMPSSPQMSRCSRVCGITPSSAATTSTTRSMPTAPATMVRTKRSCPGTSTTPTVSPVGQRQVREAELDGDAALLLLLQAIGVDAGERAHQRRLAVVDVTGGADDARERRHRGANYCLSGECSVKRNRSPSATRSPSTRRRRASRSSTCCVVAPDVEQSAPAWPARPCRRPARSSGGLPRRRRGAPPASPARKAQLSDSSESASVKPTRPPAQRLERRRAAAAAGPGW